MQHFNYTKNQKQYCRQYRMQSSLLCVPWKNEEYKKALDMVLFDAVVHEFYPEHILKMYALYKNKNIAFLI